MAAAAMPDAYVSSLIMPPMTNMTVPMPSAVARKRLRRPACSMSHHVPIEATRKKTCRKPDSSVATCGVRPIAVWKMVVT